MTYSYKQAICQQFNHHSRIDKACKKSTAECVRKHDEKINLYLNNVTARNHELRWLERVSERVSPKTGVCQAGAEWFTVLALSFSFLSSSRIALNFFFSG
jgi:hypothetical protein